MKFSRYVYLSLLLPFLFFFISWLAYRFYTPDNVRGSISFKEIKAVFFAEDGTRLPGTIRLPLLKKNIPAILFVAESNLDRNWNSAGVKFRTGARLSRSLASHGIMTIVYDQRGSGDASKERRLGPENRARDVRAVYLRLLKIYPNISSLSLLGHGEGCHAALRAINEKGYRPLPVRHIYLLSCAGSGNLLASYGRRMIRNMKEAGARPIELKIARREFAAWQAGAIIGKIVPPVPIADRQKSASKKSPFLLAFRRGLIALSSSERRFWTFEAARMNLYIELKKTLRSSDRHVEHWIGAYDREITAAERIFAQKQAMSLSSTRTQYRFRIIAGANHFLKLQEERAQSGLSAAMHRINPFTPIAPQIVKGIVEDIGSR